MSQDVFLPHLSTMTNKARARNHAKDHTP